MMTGDAIRRGGRAFSDLFLEAALVNRDSVHGTVRLHTAQGTFTGHVIGYDADTVTLEQNRTCRITVRRGAIAAVFYSAKMWHDQDRSLAARMASQDGE